MGNYGLTAGVDRINWETINEAKPVLTTIKPISHPKNNVKHKVTKTAKTGLTLLKLATTIVSIEKPLENEM